MSTRIDATRLFRLLPAGNVGILGSSVPIAR